MKYFVFSDIHGCYSELMMSLEKSGYDCINPCHKLVFLGDAFDKNREDFKTYLFLKNNIQNNKLVWILGNHDLYLLNVLKNRKINKFCYKTILNLAKGLNENIDNIDDCINELINDGMLSLLCDHTQYFLETKQYVLTHAFIPYNKKELKYDPNWRNSSNKEWSSAINNMKGFKLALVDKILIPNKTLVLGHIGAYYGNLIKLHPEIIIDSNEFKKYSKKLMKNSKKYSTYFRTFLSETVVGVDSRCFETGFVNIFVFEE
jgi:hypothetical protein